MFTVFNFITGEITGFMYCHPSNGPVIVTEVLCDFELHEPYPCQSRYVPVDPSDLPF
jgi:hypothetical protein